MAAPEPPVVDAGVIFQYAKPEELDQVVPILTENFTEITENQVRNIVLAEGAKILLAFRDAEEGPQILAVACYRVHTEDDFVELMLFCSTPHMQGHGRRLFQHLKEICALTEESHYIHLFTTPEAVGFWTKLGCRPGPGDQPAQIIAARMKTFGDCEHLLFDLTAEFETPTTALMRKAIFQGDQVSVRHGVATRRPSWRAAWVVETSDKKIKVKYIDSKQTELVPYASKRLLTDALHEAAIADDLPAFPAGTMEMMKPREPKKKAQQRETDPRAGALVRERPVRGQAAAAAQKPAPKKRPTGVSAPKPSPKRTHRRTKKAAQKRPAEAEGVGQDGEAEEAAEDAQPVRQKKGGKRASAPSQPAALPAAKKRRAAAEPAEERPLAAPVPEMSDAEIAAELAAQEASGVASMRTTTYVTQSGRVSKPPPMKGALPFDI